MILVTRECLLLLCHRLPLAHLEKSQERQGNPCMRSTCKHVNFVIKSEEPQGVTLGHLTQHSEKLVTLKLENST